MLRVVEEGTGKRNTVSVMDVKRWMCWKYKRVGRRGDGRRSGIKLESALHLQDNRLSSLSRRKMTLAIYFPLKQYIKHLCRR